MLDGKDSGHFKASESTQGGETKDVSCEKNWALGDSQTKKKVKVFDIPGLADPDLPIAEWVEEIRSEISPDENIDMALMVIKAIDFRMNIE